MENTEIVNQLIAIVKPYVTEVEALNDLNENTDFINDLKINSANLVDIVLDIEEVFGIEIDNESMQKMLTVKATVEIIQNKLKI
ncbi:acyl carrier protein [Flavobacterium sp. CYK-4]|uniref:acyl carrier protein n=1 Tax=Flavobacterium lotistagni TaxID=2709660 RepID=UPI00140D4C27|nr:phosphopantetheine-binding protein [Flavobacterium lotistagni]NHM06867.1 acyl carrier protein [Flavobacterium lotistagni]